MSRTLHLVYIPFRGVGIDNRNDEWFAQRIGIFRDYTLKSLKAQTNKDFTVWMSFRPQDKEHVGVEQLSYLLQDANISHVFTFDGLMYIDDKFGGSLSHRIRNAGRLIRAAWRNNTWPDLPSSLYQMLLCDKNKTLPRRLTSILKDIKHSFNTDYDTVLLTRLDSDDMFHKDAIETIQQPSHRWINAITIPRGYIHNTTTGKVAEWNPKTNPPFHTIKFTASDFFDPTRHIAAYRGYKSHEDIPRLLDAKALETRLFCVTTHNPKNHISTTWDHPYRGKLVDPAILKQFGL